jgi:hypothetical protein
MWKNVVGAGTLAALAFTSGRARGQAAASCPLSRPAVLARGLVGPAHLTAFGDHVYFFDAPTGLTRVAKGGGAPEPVDASHYRDIDESGGPVAFDIHALGSALYVSSPGDASAAGAALVREIGAAQTLVPGDCHVPLVQELALAPNGDLYWLQWDVSPPQSDCTTESQTDITLVPAGSARARIVYKTRGLAIDLRANSSHVFWADNSQQAIYRADFRGGVFRSVAKMLDEAMPDIVYMTVDEDNVYWSTFNPTEPSGTNAITARNQNMQISSSTMIDMIPEGLYVYANAARVNGVGQTFNVDRMKTNGHGLTNLAKGWGHGLAVDDTYVYYVVDEKTERVLMKTCKLAGL